MNEKLDFTVLHELRGVQPMPSEQQPENGKLYKWNGKKYEELSFEERIGQRIPITDEAFERVKSDRKAVQASLGIRPELSVVASAMVLKAADLPDVVEAVKYYGLRLYARS